MKLPITGQNLIDLIPQKPPFVLISSLQHVSDSHSITTFTFDESHVLSNEGKMTIAGMMENIAQTAAAKMGYECNLLNKKIPIGFIGDVRDFSFTKLPLAGEEIETEIIITNQIFDVSIITGSVKLNGEEIAHCKMKIFVEPEEKKAGQAA